MKGRYDDWRGAPFAGEGILVGLFPILGVWPTYFFLGLLVLLIGGMCYGLAILILILHYFFTQKLPGLWARARPKNEEAVGTDSKTRHLDTNHVADHSLRRARRIRITSLVVITLIVCTLGSLVLTQKWRTPEARRFPEGFRGPAIIVWGIPSYPPLPLAGGKLVETFPADGIIITSTQPQEGLAFDENYFTQTNGQFVPAGDVSVGSLGIVKAGRKKILFTQLYVGLRDLPPNKKIETDADTKTQGLFKRLVEDASDP